MEERSYHIYLHGTGGTNETKPKSTSSHTTPKDNNEDTSSFGSDVLNAYNKVQGFANGGFSSYVGQAIAGISKASPYLAIAVAVIKTADSVVSTGFSHLETYTGNYEYSMNYNNMKTVLGNVVNPVSLLKYQWNRQAQFNLQNQRTEQTRTLIGNSSLSTYKIGV